MIDRVVKINHVNETYINHIENDISFIGFHFYQKVENNNVRSFDFKFAVSRPTVNQNRP